MKRVHLDLAATAPLRPEVRAAWLAALDELAGNPSALHAAGRGARHRIDESRERVAGALGVAEEEVVFTSGGTEAINLALLGALRARRAAGAAPSDAALVTSPVEHSAVLGATGQVEREGHPVRWARVEPDGRVLADSVVAAVEPGGCALVSIQAVQNEVGSRQPLEVIGTALSRRSPGGRPFLHTDAVSAFGRSPLPLREWGVDLASFAAHKIGGPLGVGVLFRRKGVEILPLMFGGGQEGGLRPGTEDAAGIAAAALAFELAASEREELAERLRELERELWEGVRTALPAARLLGPPLGDDRRQPGTLDVLVPNEDGKVLVTRLDLAGLEVSAGSACASGSLEPSHVLRAMGHDDDAARSALRMSLGRTTTLNDVRQAVDILRTTLG